MKRIVTAALTLCVALGLTAVAQKTTGSQSLAADAALGAAIHQEEVEGNVEGAIASYKKIISQYASNRPLAAKTQYRLGLAYEKLGDAQARAAYERVTREFADQKDVASQASRRLAALTVPRGTNAGVLRAVPGTENLDFGGISQDGRWMAMTDWSLSDGGLAIRDMATGETRQLQKGTCALRENVCRFAEYAVPSPDARQVAFSWYDDTEVGGNAQLRVIASQTGASPRVLIRDADFNISPVGWSPDGRYIVASMQKTGRTKQLARVSVADGSWTVLKTLGWRLQGDPSLSYDGRFVAYGALPTDPGQSQPKYSAAEQHIYVLSIDDGKEVELVKTAAVNRSPVWTPDGAHIAFVSNLSGKFDLWSVPVHDGDTSSPKLLRRDVGDVWPVGVTRAGSYYYSLRTPGVEQVSIAAIVPDNPGQRRETFVGINPTWSPDGRFIAFSRHRGDAWDLVVRSIGTRDERVYAREGLRLGPPRWFHDSQRLLQDTVLSGRRTSTALDIVRGEFKDAWSSDTYLNGITAISPDDTTLYFVSRDPKSLANTLDRIIAADLNTGKERQIVSITPTRPNAVGFALSPDGRTLAITTADGNTPSTRLAVVGVDGTGYREIYAGFRAFHQADQLAWTKDGRSILFAVSVDGNVNGSYQIMRIGLDGGSPSFTGVNVKGLSTFDLSPDGSRIAFSTLAGATTSQELFAIDNLPARVKDAR